MIFLFPTEFEAAPFRAACPDAAVMICGVGMAEAASAVSTIEAANWVILAGIAGSYDLSKVPMNQVVEVVTEEVEELPARFATRYEIAARFDLPQVSSNTVNRSNFVGANSDIENMEGASVAAVCQRRNICFSQIRAISNLVGDDFEKWSVKSAIAALTEQLTIIYKSQK